MLQHTALKFFTVIAERSELVPFGTAILNVELVPFGTAILNVELVPFGTPILNVEHMHESFLKNLCMGTARMK